MSISEKIKSLFVHENGAKKEADQFKETMILALIHKLRSPLNAARWGLESFTPNCPEGEKPVLNETHNKVVDAINIVNDILKTAEIDSKERLSQIKHDQIDLCVVVDKILKDLDFLIKQKYITIQYHKPDSVMVSGDPKILDMALTNLFDNAFRYSPKGRVAVSVIEDIKNARLVIADNGIGIDKEDLGHMFEKFFRGKNAAKLDSNESGVGLYTTKRIVEIHKGTISIDSEINKGTTVEVVLPLLR